MPPEAFTFVAGSAGAWSVVRSSAVIGEGLPLAPRLTVHPALLGSLPPSASWLLRGVTSNDRYASRNEKTQLVAKQPPLGRPKASCAALIPIRKSPAWWDLSQDERRAIFETRSEHIQLGLQYLPAIARRLHHCRDLGEPFDFLTWFEYAPEHSAAFEELVGRLRTTEEWRYVDRELDIRLQLAC